MSGHIPAQMHQYVACRNYALIYTRDPRTCAILIPPFGWICESSGFPVIKITLVRQARMLPACSLIWAWRQTSAKRRAGHQDHERICFAFFFFFCMYGRQKPEDPQIEPKADDTITQVGIGQGLVSLVFICGSVTYS